MHGIGAVSDTAGDRIRIKQFGGAGWGDPRLREPQAVLRDVEDSLVSIESARRDYGVVVGCGAQGGLLVERLER